VGAIAVPLTGYLLVGRGAVAAVVSRAAGSPDLDQPWQLLADALRVHHPMIFINVVALGAAVVLAPVLLWRLPPGSPRPAGLPFVQPVLALSLAWLVCTPQQRPWYDAMIFPLLALMPATRLDWIVVARALTAAIGEVPGVGLRPGLHPHWLATLVAVFVRGIVPVTFLAVIAALIWLCITGRWEPGGRAGQAGGEQPLPDLATSGVLG
jgi:hypothetical protein